MEWFPGRVFAFFRRAAKEGRSRRSETSLVLFSSPPQRVFLPGFCGFAVCLCKIAALSRRLRRASFFERQRKMQKKPLKGTYFEAVPLRIPPRRPKGLRPLWNPLREKDGEMFSHNHTILTNGNGAYSLKSKS